MPPELQNPHPKTCHQVGRSFCLALTSIANRAPPGLRGQTQPCWRKLPNYEPVPVRGEDPGPSPHSPKSCRLEQLHADGRGLVPFVKPDVYQELVFETVGVHQANLREAQHKPASPHLEQVAPGASSSSMKPWRLVGGRPSFSRVTAICSPCASATIPSTRSLFDTEARSH